MQNAKIEELGRVQGRVRELLDIGFDSMTEEQRKEFDTLHALQKKLFSECYTITPL